MLTNTIQIKNSLLLKRKSINEPITLRLMKEKAFETILTDKDIALKSLDYLDKLSNNEEEIKSKLLLEDEYNSNVIIISARSSDTLNQRNA